MAALTLPRLIFGPGQLSQLGAEMRSLGIIRPMLISDRGLERAGIVALVEQAAPSLVDSFLDVPENPTADGVDKAVAAYRAASCDGIIALGGGSVIDTAKMAAALALAGLNGASLLIGKAELIGKTVAPLTVIPTTVGTGSESSPVAAIHLDPHGPPIGTRSHLLVPKLALCDPDLAHSLPPRLIAATGIDALSHCIEGFFAEPEHPIIDALALDGIARVCANITTAVTPDGDDARASLMAAAYAGGVAIHKGLGPAHAIALACGNQHVHHGTLVGVALPHTTRLLAHHLPGKAAKIAEAMRIDSADDIGEALAVLISSLGLPTTLSRAGYVIDDMAALIADLVDSPFNSTSPYVPNAQEYQDLALRIQA